MQRIIRLSLWCWLATVAWTFATAADDLPFEEEAAIRSAADRVAASVVRIETAGVSEAAIASSAEASPASGPSTGIVVEEGGWVLATAFAVPRDAGEAIVVLPGPTATGGQRRVARVVGRDLSRGLVLLRVDDAGLPPVPEWVPRADLAVGQWTIAMGRAWDLAVPSVAVGILSAKNRSWGRSVQTDASISPANYGGPLIDIAGRVIGILAPLPADTAGMNVGTELYDSGIGFAVPFEDIFRVLPRLKNGETLSPGVLGIGYRSRDPFTGEARIATCRPGSPAAKAGLRAGDLIVAADGLPVTRIAELRHAIAARYAGDTVSLTVERGGAATPRDDDAPQEAGPAAESAVPRPQSAPPVRIDVQVELAAALPPYRRPILGIVPARSAARDARPGPVKVAWVWTDSPAAKAGIAAGDQIEAVRTPSIDDDDTAGEGDAVPVESASALAGLVAGMEMGRSLGLVIARDGTRRTVSVELTAMPADLPADLPTKVPAFEPAGPAAKAVDAAIVERLEAAEIAQPPLVVLPAAPPQDPLGVIIYLDVPRGPVDEMQGLAWKAAAARYGVAVILPGSTDPQRWGREDLAGIKRAVATLAAKRAIDPARIAVAGSGAGGAFAWLVAESLGPVGRGVALIDSTLPRQAAVEPAEPGRSRWVLFGTPADAAEAPQLSPRAEADRRRLEEAGFSVGTLAVMRGEGPPTAVLAAWVEALGLL
jgi:serine protease Do